MQNLYKIILFSLFVVFIISCSEDFFSTTLEIDPPEHTDQLVTNAFLNIDEGLIEVVVSKTYSVADVDQEFDLVDDAVVILKDDQSLDQRIEYNGEEFGFNYTNDQILSSSNNFDLEVNYADFRAKASASAPCVVELSEFEFIADGGIDSDGEDRSRIEFSFDDPADEENYYALTIFLSNANNPTEPAFPTYTDTNDPSGSRGFDFHTLLISDASFNGERKKFKALMYRATNEEVENRVFAKWQMITKEYFQYSKTLNIASDLEDNPFATPVQIFTNFDGGIGIFSVYRERWYSVF